MRYGPEHKAETRLKVVRAAAAAIRRRGPAGVGVASLMRSVGLTHGGFYAHFDSKDDLVALAVAQMFADAGATYRRLVEGLAPRDALAAYIDRYVSAAHRDQPARGCPLTSIAADLARHSGPARAAFDAGVAGLVGRLAGWLAADGRPAPDARGRALLAEMVGAVALSRAVSDPALSDSILAACRASARACAGLPSVAEREIA